MTMTIIQDCLVDSLSTEGRRNQRFTGPWIMKSKVANRIRKGTRRAKVGDGVLINNQAPMPPPTKLTAPRRMRMIELSSIVRRYPNKPPNKPGTRATVQVAFAILGSRPSQIIIGKTSNMPPPAIEFTTPAKNAAINIRAACQMDIGRECNGRRAKRKGRSASADYAD